MPGEDRVPGLAVLCRSGWSLGLVVPFLGRLGSLGGDHAGCLDRQGTGAAGGAGRGGRLGVPPPTPSGTVCPTLLPRAGPPACPLPAPAWSPALLY